MILLGLGGWAYVRGGIVELGRKGQNAGGSVFQVIVEGNVFDDPNHLPGDAAEVILERIRLSIDTDMMYSASVYNDPNDPLRNAIRVTRQPSGDLASLGVFEDDLLISGGASDFGVLSSPPQTAATLARINGVDAVNQNGNVRLDLTLTVGGISTHIISTAGKTAAQVNQALVASLQAAGFVVIGLTNGPWDISKPGDTFRRAEFSHTDTGVSVSGVTLFLPVQGPGSAASIPTLSEWGLIILTLLTAGAAVLLLLRRRSREAI